MTIYGIEQRATESHRTIDPASPSELAHQTRRQQWRWRISLLGREGADDQK
jgi:hypothetical protein